MTSPIPTSGPLPPPFIDIVGIANFRDVGGYSTTSGKGTIRRDLVFRCADPSGVQPEGLDKLKALGVRKVFDLRSLPEIQKQGPEWSGLKDDSGVFVTREPGDDHKKAIEADQIERVWCPVFATKDYGPEQVAIRFSQYAKSGSEATKKGFVQAYSNILAEGVTAYKTILTHLAQEKPEPCVVHCTAGKDRTGVLVALLFLVSGVPAEVIANEYSLTDEGLKHLKPLFKERLLKNPALAGNDKGVDNMISSKPENMAATIDLINEKYGGADEYILNVVGLSEAQLGQLKSNLLQE